MRTSVSPLPSLLFPNTTLALYPNPYGNPTGSILLCADPHCQQNAYSNSWVLGGDFCAGMFSSSLSSYLITLRPTCDNGSYADWATYSDTGCEKEKERVPYSNDDVCEIFAGVEAVAFICEGFYGKGGGGGAGSSKSMEQVITASYSDIPVSIGKNHFPSSYLVTTTAQTVTSTSPAAIENTASASVSRSTAAQRNGTQTSATLGAPSSLRTSGASTLASCSRFVSLLIPACFLFAGL